MRLSKPEEIKSIRIGFSTITFWSTTMDIPLSMNAVFNRSKGECSGELNPESFFSKYSNPDRSCTPAGIDDSASR
jgi:hypothetical protein